jgi:uncharacterized protein YndB with AHSA1/START domain
MAKNNLIGEQGKQDVLITRVLNAPRELVWKAWTDPQHFMQWWGPKDYTCPFCEIDLRVGGKYLNCMRSPEGKEYWSTGVYREIIPMERLVFTDCFADEQGNVVPASHYGLSSDFPLEMLVVLTLEDLGGKTRMVLEHIGVPTGPDSDGTQQGWSESFDKLVESLMQSRRYQ